MKDWISTLNYNFENESIDQFKLKRACDRYVTTIFIHLESSIFHSILQVAKFYDLVNRRSSFVFWIKDTVWTGVNTILRPKLWNDQCQKLQPLNRPDISLNANRQSHDAVTSHLSSLVSCRKHKSHHNVFLNIDSGRKYPLLSIILLSSW